MLIYVLPPSPPSCSICSTSQCTSEVEVRIYKGDSFDLFGSLRKRRQSVETFILQVVKVMLGLSSFVVGVRVCALDGWERRVEGEGRRGGSERSGGRGGVVWREGEGRRGVEEEGGEEWGRREERVGWGGKQQSA